ncbi:DUF1129 domain-containing protein [Desemzia sp. FAM 23991]|uniref:DUF1129 domain-containing protein n=1 Tax=unclassified Desemzia TaxID=2685243 RepID=UPI0038840373
MKKNEEKKVNAEQAVDNLVALKEENTTLYAQLTNKNEDYMAKLDKRLIEANYPDDDKTRVFNDMLKNIISQQASGITARKLYGTVTERSIEIVEGPQQAVDGKAERSEDWKLYVDGALMLGGMFALITGLSALLGDGANSTGMGIITLLLNFIVGGFVILAITKNAPTQGVKGSLLRYILVSVVAMFAWIIVMTGSMALLPTSINVVLPGIVNLIIGALAFAGKWYFKRKYHVKGTLF